MNRKIVLLWGVVVLAGAGTLGSAGHKAAEARGEAAKTQRELVQVTQQATKLARLRSGSAVDVPLRPEGALTGRVAAAMSRSGLPNSALQGLSPEAQSTVTGQGGAKLIRQRATLTLQGLSLPQLGKFFDAWTTAEPDWVVSGIDLSPMPGQGANAIGTDLTLRAVITIEGVFKMSVRELMSGTLR